MLLSVSSSLATVPPNTLQDLCIRITGPGPNDMLGIRLEDVLPTMVVLDDLLAGPGFKSMRRLSVEFSVRMPEAKLRAVQERVRKEYLPNVDPRVWVDDLSDAFEGHYADHIVSPS